MNPVPIVWQYVVHVIDSVSSFPFAEQAKFIGHFLDLSSGKTESTTSLESRGYSPEALALMERRTNEKFNAQESLGVKFKIPLKNFRSEYLSLAFQLHDGYEKGILPFPGSLTEQPAQIMEIFGLINALKFEQEQKVRKKMEQEAKKQNAKSKSKR